MKVISVCAAALVASAAASGLEAVWRYDVPCGVNALPAVIDCDGKGALDVIVPTLFDGSVWILNERGDLLRQLTTDRWIQGSVAVSANPRILAFEDSSKRIIVRDLAGNAETSVLMEGRPLQYGGLCLADLDNDGRSEIVTVRRNGRIGAFDAKLKPCWQYDAGASIETPPAVAPVFNGTAVVYVCDTEGVLHAIGGNGLPLWRFETRTPESPRTPANAPLVVQLYGQNPSVIFTQDPSVMTAVDAVDGLEQWHLRTGAGNLGCPAILVPATGGPREILVVSDKGAIIRIDGSGNVLERSQLPEGTYIPKPLIADVDGDQQPELLVAGTDDAVTIASMNGAVKERLVLRGNAEGGILLADINRNGLLELLAATDRARIYCFNTLARKGWTNPRANAALNGYVPSLVPHDLPAPRHPSRRVRIESMAVNSYTEKIPVGTAFLRVRAQKAGRYLSAVIRRGNRILGSTFRPFDPQGIPVPFVQEGSNGLTLDLNFHDDKGKIVACSSDIALRPGTGRIVELTPLDTFFETLGVYGEQYMIPKTWELPRVLGRDSWHVAHFMPDVWEESTDESPRSGLLAQAAPLIGLPGKDDSRTPFGPHHKQWPAISVDAKPFFVESGLGESMPRDAYEAIVEMSGPRFLGFLAFNGDEIVRKEWRNRFQETAKTHGAFTEAITRDLEWLSAENYGKLSVRQEDFLFHHQALAAGAQAAFAELGRDAWASSLRLAFLRGAARQYGTRPWGVSVSPDFRGAYPLDEFPSVDWESPRRYGMGPDCGHSTSLMFRLLMAAYFAGATYVQRDPDPRLDLSAPNRMYSMRFRDDVKRWQEYVRACPQRGIPYTPFAFVMDLHHTWRPGETDVSSRPATDARASIDAVFRHVFAADTEGDFEQGFLTNAPYGDVFDVITDNASVEVLSSYGVLWPLGNMIIKGDTRERLVQYVKAGGILVLNANLAKEFPPQFLGLRLESITQIAAQIQTGLAALPPIAAPYTYRVMTPSRNTEILAWTDTGAPLLTWRNTGDGLVIVAATDSWLDERGHLLPLVPGLLRAFADAFLPVQQLADVQMFLNRGPDGWTIALINNNGVAKVPTLVPAVDPAQAADCVLHFKKGVPLQFLSYRGEFRWNNRANGLHTRLQPGEVAVVKATFGNK